jgi:hypothetical protein
VLRHRLWVTKHVSPLHFKVTKWVISSLMGQKAWNRQFKAITKELTNRCGHSNCQNRGTHSTCPSDNTYLLPIRSRQFSRLSLVSWLMYAADLIQVSTLHPNTNSTRVPNELTSPYCGFAWPTFSVCMTLPKSCLPFTRSLGHPKTYACAFWLWMGFMEVVVLLRNCTNTRPGPQLHSTIISYHLVYLFLSLGGTTSGI